MLTLSRATLSRPRSAVSQTTSLTTSLATSLATVFGVWRQRRALNRLDSHLLHDIGLSEYAAAKEASRPIWDAPAGWLR